MAHRDGIEPSYRDDFQPPNWAVPPAVPQFRSRRRFPWTSIIMFASVGGFCLGLTNTGYRNWTQLLDQIRRLANPSYEEVPYRGIVLAVTRNSSDLLGVITTVEPRGYKVVTADDVRSGLNELGRRADQIRMIVLRPGMPKPETALLRKTAPPRARLVILPPGHSPDWLALELLKTIQDQRGESTPAARAPTSVL